VSFDEDHSLLADIAERQKALQAQLAAMAADQAELLETYTKSNAVYRAQAEQYEREQRSMRLSKAVANGIRLFALLLLAFIAYRVSR
jgi:hypothetical protein